MAEQMMPAALPAKYLEYYNSLMGQLRGEGAAIGYDPMSEGRIKANLIQTMRPQLEQSIYQRQNATSRNRALIDADAAARGMGPSTWVTDAKGRLSDSEMADVSLMRSNYGAALAQQLGSRLAGERANKMAADQFNAGQNAAAQQQALGMAWNLYQQWLSEQKRGGRGGGRGGPANPKDPEEPASPGNVYTGYSMGYNYNAARTPAPNRALDLGNSMGAMYSQARNPSPATNNRYWLTPEPPKYKANVKK